MPGEGENMTEKPKSLVVSGPKVDHPLPQRNLDFVGQRTDGSPLQREVVSGGVNSVDRMLGSTTKKIEERISALGTGDPERNALQAEIQQRNQLGELILNGAGERLGELVNSGSDQVAAGGLRGIAGNEVLFGQVFDNLKRVVKPNDNYYGLLNDKGFVYFDNPNNPKGQPLSRRETNEERDKRVKDHLRETMVKLADDLEEGDQRVMNKMRQVAQEVEMKKAKIEGEKKAKDDAKKQKDAEEAAKKVKEADEAKRLKEAEDWKKSVLGGIENGDRVDEQTWNRLNSAISEYKDTRGEIAGLEKVSTPLGFSFQSVQGDLEKIGLKPQLTQDERQFQERALKLRGVMMDVVRETGLLGKDDEKNTVEAVKKRVVDKYEKNAIGENIDPRESMEKIVSGLGKDGKGFLDGWQKSIRQEYLDAAKIAGLEYELGYRQFLEMGNGGIDSLIGRIQKKSSLRAVTSVHSDPEISQALRGLGELYLDFDLNYSGDVNKKREYTDAASLKFSGLSAAGGGMSSGVEDGYRMQMVGISLVERKMFLEGDKDVVKKWIDTNINLLTSSATLERSSQRLNYFIGYVGENKTELKHYENFDYARDVLALYQLETAYLAADSASNFDEPFVRYVQSLKNTMGAGDNSARVDRLMKKVNFSLLESKPDLLNDYLKASSQNEVYGDTRYSAVAIDEYARCSTDVDRATVLSKYGVANFEDLKNTKLYEKDDGTVGVALMDRMSEQMGLSEVDLNIYLWMYDITNRRAVMQAFYDGEEKTAVRWSGRMGSQFARMMREGMYRKDKTKIDDSVYDMFNLAAGDVTMFIKDKIEKAKSDGKLDLKGLGINGRLNVSAGRFETEIDNWEEIKWTNATTQGPKLFESLADTMEKAMSTRAKIDAFIKKPGWETYPYEGWRHLYSNKFGRKADGVLTTDMSKVQVEESVSEGGILGFVKNKFNEFARRKAPLKDRITLRDMLMQRYAEFALYSVDADRVKAGKSSYFNDTRALIEDFRAGIKPSNLSPEPGEEEFREQLEAHLVEYAVKMRNKPLNKNQRRQAIQDELASLASAALKLGDSIMETRFIGGKK